MKLLITLVGLVLVLEGLPYAVFPEAMQAWMRRLQASPAWQLRVLGFLSMIVGLFLCFLTQRSGWLP